MAKIGLSYLRDSNLTEAQDGTPTFDGAKMLGKAVSSSTSITNNSAELYADDALAESDTSFQSGTLTLGTDDDRDTVFAPLLGHEVTEEGEVISNANDVAPWVGVGRIITKIVENVRYYKAVVLLKVKFAEPNDDDNTKGASVAFGTPSIEGKIATLANGNWRLSQTFPTKDEAIAYIEGIFASASSTFSIVYDANGGTGTIATDVVNVGNSTTIASGASLTAPAGKTFAGWAYTSNATAVAVQAGVTYTPNRDVTLFAVWVAE